MHNDNLTKDIHLTFLLPTKGCAICIGKSCLLSHISLSLQTVDMKVQYMQAKNNILCRALE